MINIHPENSFASKRIKHDVVYKEVDPLFDRAQTLQKRNRMLKHVIRQMDADIQVLREVNKRLRTSRLTLMYQWIKNKLSFMRRKK